MAPRKSTTKASSTDPDPSELIVLYLKTQNRPYSATDISSNLHNKVTKTKTDKLLKELFERNEIDGKVSGKQWVYWCLQEAKDAATPEELAELDASITALRESISTLKATHKAKIVSLEVLRSAPTTEALRHSVHKLEIQKAEIESRLNTLRSGGIKPVSAEEKYMGEAEHREWEKKALSRQRIWKEAEGIMLEAMTKDELYDRLGIDDEQ